MKERELKEYLKEQLKHDRDNKQLKKQDRDDKQLKQPKRKPYSKIYVAYVRTYIIIVLSQIEIQQLYIQ